MTPPYLPIISRPRNFGWGTSGDLWYQGPDGTWVSIPHPGEAGKALVSTADGWEIATVSGPIPVALEYAISDEVTAITNTDNPKITVRSPYAFTLTEVRASLSTASSSGDPTFDIDVSGASILSTKLSIDSGQKTSVGATVPVVISDPAILNDVEITFHIDVAGTGAKGAKIKLLGTRP